MAPTTFPCVNFSATVFSEYQKHRPAGNPISSDSVQFGFNPDRKVLAISKLIDVLNKAQVDDIELQTQQQATFKINGRSYRLVVSPNSRRNRRDGHMGPYTETKSSWMLESLETVSYLTGVSEATCRMVRPARLKGLIPAKWEDVPASPGELTISPKIVIGATAWSFPDDPEFDSQNVLYTVRDHAGTVLPVSVRTHDVDAFVRLSGWLTDLQQKVFSAENIEALEQRQMQALDEILI